MSRVRCEVCPRACLLEEGQRGFCGARVNEGGLVISRSYGYLTALALDPIEKKPLAFFLPGSRILSVGSYGCSMDCPFCQNHEIARMKGEAAPFGERLLPKELAEIAGRERARGNIGLAYTYNEALVGYEYVRDCAGLIKEAGMINVLVTNGLARLWVLEELLPLIDAMNIDLKCFSKEGYRRLGGDLETVKAFIARSAAACHVELTTLIVPGISDSIGEMEEEAAWISSLNPDLPLHITRYFPRYRYDQPPTPLPLLLDLQKAAKRHLKRVVLGNV